MDEFLSAHLLGVSRTYALVVPMLPEPLATPVGLAYLLMRIVDTVEDADGLAPAERERLFAWIDAALRGEAEACAARPELGDTDDERRLLRAAPEVFARLHALPAAMFGPIANCAREMIAGVRKLLVRSAERGRAYPAVANLDELREYCHYVAGVVGEMLCALKAHVLQRPDLLDRLVAAERLGLGLQLVNILKDAPSDATHGRRYLPPADTKQADGEIRAGALALAASALRTGVEYVLALPAEPVGLRHFCGLPIVWGALTLAGGATKVDRARIFETLAQFGELASQDDALRAWLEGLVEDITDRRGGRRAG